MNANDEALLNDLLDGRLDEDAARALEARLASEADLNATWEDLQQIRALLRRPDPARAPAAFLAGVHRRIDGDDDLSLEERAAVALLRPSPRAARPRRRLIALPLAAAAVLMIGLVVADRLGHQPPPPVEVASRPEAPTGDLKTLDRLQSSTRRVAGDAGDALSEPDAGPAPRSNAKERQRPSRRSSGAGATAAVPGLAGGGGGAPRFQPGGAVPTGLRRPSDQVRPDAFAPSKPGADPATTPAAPMIVYALSTESVQRGTASLGEILEGRLEASLNGTWRVVAPPTASPQGPPAPVDASAPRPPLQLVLLDGASLDPTRIDVGGRRVFDSVTLMLSMDQARLLGTFAQDEAGEGTTDAPAAATSPAPAREVAPAERSAKDEHASRADEAEAGAGAEADKASARKVRVRVWLVR